MTTAFVSGPTFAVLRKPTPMAQKVPIADTAARVPLSAQSTSGSRLLENAFASEGESTSTRECLFHQPAFFRLHAAQRAAYFEWLSGSRVIASVHFSGDDAGHWRSPARGTFAGIAAMASIPQEELLAFVDAVLARLRALGARSVEVLPAPTAHDPAAVAAEIYAWCSRGLQVARCDINHSLYVDERDLADRMSVGNRKRLRKCEREGYHSCRVPLSDFAQVYAAIERNRQTKGYTMSMTLEQLRHMADVLPDSLVLFGCHLRGELAAAAVCVRLDTNRIYVLYWGDVPGHESCSPVVSLADCIYRYCQAEGIHLLDVGTSSMARKPNPGLVRFKRGLGFEESLKFRLEARW